MARGGRPFPVLLQVSGVDVPAGRCDLERLALDDRGVRLRGGGGGRGAGHVPRPRRRHADERPPRARRAAARRARDPARLPLPSDADPQGRGAAAELPRRTRGRFAQHGHRRHQQSAAQRVRPAAARRSERAAAQRPDAALRRPLLQVLFVGRSHPVRRRSEIRRHVDACRHGARSRTRRAVGPAARRRGDGDRRRRHVRRGDRRVARQPEGAIDPGVHRRRRPGALRARRAGDARRDAAQRAQGNLARRRRRVVADRLQRAVGAADRRGRRTHRQHADGQAAVERRGVHREGALHGVGSGRAPLHVQGRVEKVLYYEGEPRFEYKFIRRALGEDSVLKLAADKNLQLVSLDRTAENKYYRQGVSNPDEVITGFPKTREELFQYRALILGSVEAASFTPEQLRMIADFVSKRGGSLLMLGGRRAFAEGGWAGTPVGEVLPVVMGAPNQKYVATDIAVRPTRAGATFPVTQIADTEDASAKKWDEMPELSAVNQIKDVKPGATVLLTGTDKSRQEHVVLAYQRYGRGKALAMPVQDVWYWRMASKVAVNDTTHSMFWRRMVRWLVDGVPDQVNVTTTSDRVEPGEPIKIAAEVLDNGYAEVDDGRVVAHITAPSGKSVDVPVDWTVTRDGDYRASFVPDESGIYDIKVTADRPSPSSGQPT